MVGPPVCVWVPVGRDGLGGRTFGTARRGRRRGGRLRGGGGRRGSRGGGGGGGGRSGRRSCRLPGPGEVDVHARSRATGGQGQHGERACRIPAEEFAPRSRPHGVSSLNRTRPSRTSSRPEP